MADVDAANFLAPTYKRTILPPPNHEQLLLLFVQLVKKGFIESKTGKYTTQNETVVKNSFGLHVSLNTTVIAICRGKCSDCCREVITQRQLRIFVLCIFGMLIPNHPKDVKTP